MARKKLSRGLRKRIRQEKARIRREEHNDQQRTAERLAEVLKDLGVSFLAARKSRPSGRGGMALREIDSERAE